MATIIIMTGLAVIAVSVIHALAMRTSMREEMEARERLQEFGDNLGLY
jgi:hypothetical protein